MNRRHSREQNGHRYGGVKMLGGSREGLVAGVAGVQGMRREGYESVELRLGAVES